MEKITLNSKITILLVEDTPSDTRLIREYLNEIDINNVLHTVTDGVEALNFLNKHCKQSNHCPHLVILDLNLPRMSGLEVLKEIKKDNNFKKIPVIILTTSETEEDIKECYNNYANCYLVKPADYNEFREVIESIKNFWLNTATFPP